MNNNIDTNISSTPGYSKNLSRTSYDIHQEINAKVIGVLKYNNEIRKDLLNRNIGKYNLVNLDEGIGYISNFYSNLSHKPSSFGKDGLLGFTHLDESDYQKELNKKYDIGEFIQYYKHGSLPEYNYLRWNGLYDDYTKYIDEVYGFKFTTLNLLSNMFKTDKLKNGLGFEPSEETNLTIQSILYDILQYDNLKYAMEKTRIGTITPNPLASLAGSIVTNINNFSGKDTSLGLITNHLYAHALKNSAQFNTLRRTNYITQEVYDKLGLKLSTISTIGSDFRIDDETGRLAFEIGGSTTDYINNSSIGLNIENISYDSFISKQIDINRNIFDTNNALIRNIARNEAYFDSSNILHKRYLPFNDVNGKSGHYDSAQNSIKLLDARLNPYIGNKVYKAWNEGDSTQINDTVFSYNGQNGYSGFRSSDKKEGLLETTNKLFQSHNENGIDTLIGRFHTTGGRDRKHNEVNLLQTAVSIFGMSHGRNLLNKKAYENGIAEKENGYSNPYCRTWTYHKQYQNINDLIRPFKGEDAEIENLHKKWDLYGRRKDGSKRLKDYGTLNSNGFVNITPTEEYSEYEKYDVDVKKCMFSIENLAWKDVTEGADKSILSSEQIGPNGGRIMWFPPYDLNFNEVVNVDWNSNDFIGRGEKIYTYKNTDRSGTLSFTLLVDHPSILDMWKKNGASLDDDKNEQQLLRFFAGCDTLQLDNAPLEPIKSNVTPKPDDEPVTIPVIVEDKPLNDIIFYIFYSNNYSGVDNRDEAISYLSNVYESTGATVTYYKVDNSLKNENLLETNKKDAKNYNLNYDINAITANTSFIDATTSFNDIVNNFNSIIKDKSTILGVDIESYASNHGYNKKNKNLCKNRSETAKYFIEKNGINSNINIIPFKNINIQKVDDIDIKNVSGESAKRARFTKVIIRRRKNMQISDLSNISGEYVNGNLDNPIVIDSISTTYNKTVETSGSGKLTKRQKRAIKKIKKEHQNKFNEWANDSDRMLSSVSDQLKTINTNIILNDSINNSQDILNKLQESLPNTRIINGSIKAYKENEYNDFIENKATRWENEAQYFSMLKENDSFLYTRLIDKIKYFTPAFHSITPEGFNSRLSFLHQCTRQGSTISVSDNTNEKNKSYKSAGNLAFGRPPICVLRIGDFYHTRIIIDSVSINYENTTWDMNPEGIGMQPMFAKISLNFKFLGGSDLGAPISRLQNALSFNYYANQSVYDDRSDIGIYENKKAIIQGKPWKPNKN